MSADGFWEAWPASPPSLYSDEPLTNQLGPNGKVTTFVNAQGLQLACYLWPAQQPRAVLQLNHGSGSYLMEFIKSQARIPCALICTASPASTICICPQGRVLVPTEQCITQPYDVLHACRGSANRRRMLAPGWNASTMLVSPSRATTCRAWASRRACTAAAATSRAWMTSLRTPLSSGGTFRNPSICWVNASETLNSVPSSYVDGIRFCHSDTRPCWSASAGTSQRQVSRVLVPICRSLSPASRSAAASP